MFSNKDLEQIQARGSDLETVKGQIERFKSGFPYLQIEAPASTADGIKQLDTEEKRQYANRYDKDKKDLTMVKFVPASGAASRMFKELYAFRKVVENHQTDDDLLQQPEYAAMRGFFEDLTKFAFYNDLRECLHAKGINLEALNGIEFYKAALDGLLSEDCLNYGNMPKALLQFHTYNSTTRTPVEEHLVEGALYARDSERNVQIHFTVSPEHRQRFIQHVHQRRSMQEKAFKVNYEVTFSEQRPSTDTIAVDLDNEPIREKDGSLLFRPAGHGALLENLNMLDCDLVFIKNIDNVVPDRLKKETVEYKKALAGILLATQSMIFDYLRALESFTIDDIELDEIAAFVTSHLMVRNLPFFNSRQEKIRFLREKLNRPIRVCGMVKNEGEPGGGPFYARHPDGTVQLQIAESSQIDETDENQLIVLSRATHFNPVDIVCGVKDYHGRKFDLRKFVDHNTGFISIKSKDGRELKAQELPGLWNGSMSDWNTIFVEVPMVTFNPVKTVHDLLRDAHQ